MLLGSLLGLARPAAADPAKPTDYRSGILSIRPSLPAGVDVAVVGGDAFLELRIDRGHRVVVPDYQQAEDGTPPPYLWVRADGTVEVNERSIAATINESRYGSDSTEARPDEAPSWKVVARDGRHTWHDHRIHWMSPRAPTGVGPDRRVDMGGTDGTWTVDLAVDGRTVTLRGELLLLPSPSPAPWLAVVVASGGAILGLAAWAIRSRSTPPHRGVPGRAAHRPARRRRSPRHRPGPRGGRRRRGGAGVAPAGSPGPAPRPPPPPAGGDGVNLVRTGQ